MTRLLTRSLFSQTLAILLAGLLASHAIGFWIYSADREQAVRAVGGAVTAQRIANATRLVRDAPPEAWARLASALGDAAFRVELLDQAPAFDATEEVGTARVLREVLARQAAAPGLPPPRVAVTPGSGWSPPLPGPRGHGGRMMEHAPGPGAMGAGAMGPGGMGPVRDLRVAMPLPDGQWLSFAAGLPARGPDPSLQFLLSMAIMAAITLGASVFAVRRVTRPLAELAAAADRIGRDVGAPPVEERGTTETRLAARAFNDMQRRLRHLLDSRMQMLAAISHDLRTPLTLLRLRVENIPETEDRSRMLATIDDMDAMIGAMLRFARDETASEPMRRTDLAALVQSLVDDMGDAGLPVSMAPTDPVVIACRPAALKRAVTNLVDNALKYGETARVSLATTPEAIEIRVEDDGPGLPPEEIARATEPFSRVERSRSRETGGVGLGLAITLAIVQSNGGTLMLGNLREGGLRAAIILSR
jgi:signal transduction histidine kinase